MARIENYRLVWLVCLALFVGCSSASPGPVVDPPIQAVVPTSSPASAEIRMHNGRPTIFIDGKPTALPTYSPISWRREPLQKNMPWFGPHHMGAYFIAVPAAKGGAYGESGFWHGDQIGYDDKIAVDISLDEQANFILAHDPTAYLIVRNGPTEPPSWRKLHRDQLVVDETGRTLEVPSLASDLSIEGEARATRAVVDYCESRPWANHVIGYWYGLRVEGTHEPMMEHMLFDHSDLMLARWRDYLRAKYKNVESLRAAHNDPALTFENVQVPFDKLRRSVPEVSNLPYWQNARDNQPLRDYLALSSELFLNGFRKIAASNAQAQKEIGRKRLFIYDGFKQVMLGWSNWGFFNMSYGWPMAYAELMAGSGHMNVASVYDTPGFDGIVTPHDYQARGVGYICEPEGIVDSAVLNGKYFFTELDIRTYQGDREKGAYGTARNIHEFEAINWRDAATGMTRGFNGYWMDLVGDWYGNKEIHDVIGRTVEVLKQSVSWEHKTVPGIAVIIDDSSALETNGEGNVLNESVMWEMKMGLAHCGVPVRTYLLQDLALDSFPDHRVFYFPNLYKVDDQRLALLRRKVFKDGNVVVWGPGSGISDGQVIGAASAGKLTGFDLEFLNVNHTHRVAVTNFSNPITAGLDADTVFGSPLSYGPLLFPKDGTQLGLAWTKQARNYSGLSVKAMGKGARGDNPAGAQLGAGDWSSVFVTATPLPTGLWRNLARYAGAHVYLDTNDVILADSSIVAIHSIQAGERTIRLPGRFDVVDLVSGRRVGESIDEIHIVIEPPQTRVFRLIPSEPAKGR